MSGPAYGRRASLYLPSLTESRVAPQITLKYGRRAVGAAPLHDYFDYFELELPGKGFSASEPHH